MYSLTWLQYFTFLR